MLILRGVVSGSEQFRLPLFLAVNLNYAPHRSPPAVEDQPVVVIHQLAPLK
jgi:hypothetical protein